MGGKERLQVTFSRMFSKEFNKEFKKLKEASDVFTYKNTGATTGDVGNITLNKENLNEEGEVINKEFDINYTTKNIDKNSPIGRSRLHVLFEETYHSSDYVEGRSAMVLLENKILGWETASQRMSGESAAWKFAADFAPFYKRKEKWDIDNSGSKLRLFTKNTVISQIRATNDISSIAKMLFLPYKVKASTSAGSTGTFTSDKTIY